MSGFQILENVAGGAMRFTERAAQVGMVDDAARATLTTTKGMTNPLFIATQGMVDSITPSLFKHLSTKVVKGGGTSAFDHAVESLLNLGKRHGVEGISLSSNPTLYGGLMFKGSEAFVAGKPVIDTIGLGAAQRIDAAARRVMAFIDVAK